MKGYRGLLTLICLLAATPAMAGTVYRCDSADGSRSYVSKRVPGAKCTAISSYQPAKGRRSDAWVPSKTPSNTGAPATIISTPAAIRTPAASVDSGVASAPATVASAAPGRRTTRRVSDTYYSYIVDGVRVYASRAPKGVAGASAVRRNHVTYLETCFACAPDPGVNFNTLRLNTAAYAAEISKAARQYGVDEAVVRAIIHAESAFNPNALSRVGAQGLMQLMPGTARRFGVDNAFNASENISGGVQYLAWLLKRFNGDLTLAAAGYNAGEGAVDKYKGVPPYSETQRYVQRVAVLAERYRGSLAKAK